MHHTNVDRLIALWQAVNYNNTVQTGSYRTRGLYATPANTVITADSDLKPFYRDANNFHNGKTASSTKNFGYTYPELVHENSATKDQLRRSVIRSVNILYGDGSMASQPDPAASSSVAPAPSSTASSSSSTVAQSSAVSSASPVSSGGPASSSSAAADDDESDDGDNNDGDNTTEAPTPAPTPSAAPAPGPANGPGPAQGQGSTPAPNPGPAQGPGNGPAGKGKGNGNNRNNGNGNGNGNTINWGPWSWLFGRRSRMVKRDPTLSDLELIPEILGKVAPVLGDAINGADAKITGGSISKHVKKPSASSSGSYSSSSNKASPVPATPVKQYSLGVQLERSELPLPCSLVFSIGNTYVGHTTLLSMPLAGPTYDDLPLDKAIKAHGMSPVDVNKLQNLLTAQIKMVSFH